LNFLLNQEPPKSWVAKHPIIKKEVIDEQGQKMKVPYEYLPIDKVEYLLRIITIGGLKTQRSLAVLGCIIQIRFFLFHSNFPPHLLGVVVF
jgi:hypothetical protein